MRGFYHYYVSASSAIFTLTSFRVRDLTRPLNVNSISRDVILRVPSGVLTTADTTPVTYVDFYNYLNSIFHSERDVTAVSLTLTRSQTKRRGSDSFHILSLQWCSELDVNKSLFVSGIYEFSKIQKTALIKMKYIFQNLVTRNLIDGVLKSALIWGHRADRH